MKQIGDKLHVSDIPEENRSNRHEKFIDKEKHGEWSRGDGFEPCTCRTVIFSKVDGVHYGEYKCKRCGKHYDYVKKPENEGQRNKTSTHSKEKIVTEKGYDSAFCFICLRGEDELNESETITRDHVIPLDHGGQDEIGNLRLLCNTCHKKFKPWIRILTGVRPDNAY